jgi:hypothetical protein
MTLKWIASSIPFISGMLTSVISSDGCLIPLRAMLLPDSCTQWLGSLICSGS